ncbi:FHA domain-containing protein, partial [Eggerthella sinensis]|uniref:FHA domain-containing protein n=1 Tax=Eggerthella sinensis TaxID=242230 RepID=UPI0022E1584F
RSSISPWRRTVVFAGGPQAATPMPAQAAVRARLVDTTNNRTYDLASARLLIGRESKNDIAVHDVNASRTHAELRFEPQGIWTITDLGSTNGTLVNGREVATQPLSEGDRITIGMTNFVFTQA